MTTRSEVFEYLHRKDLPNSSTVRDTVETLIEMGVLTLEPDEPTGIGAVVWAARQSTDDWSGLGDAPSGERWTRVIEGDHVAPWVGDRSMTRVPWRDILHHGPIRELSPGLHTPQD